jgi:CheY-like chemotaxis protein
MATPLAVCAVAPKAGRERAPPSISTCPEQPIEAAAEGVPDRVPDRHSTARILGVDNDKEVREVTGKMSREAGCAVTAVASGRDALDALARGEQFDLLVIDIAMPGLNGIESARRTRKQWPALKVPYVTGYADLGGDHRTDDERRIKKPFRFAELDAVVRAAL